MIIEIPYTMAQAWIYSIFVYGMIGYEWTASKFLLYTFFTFITILYYIYTGFMLIAVSPNQETAAILNGVISTTLNVFSGFTIPRPVSSQGLIIMQTLSKLHNQNAYS